MSQVHVIAELAQIAFSDTRDVVSWEPIVVRLQGCLSKSVRLRLHDKVASLRLLGLDLGLFAGTNDRQQGVEP